MVESLVSRSERLAAPAEPWASPWLPSSGSNGPSTALHPGRISTRHCLMRLRSTDHFLNFCVSARASIDSGKA
eukprot:11478006-Alexandrium_andersonii.AAC.1